MQQTVTASEVDGGRRRSNVCLLIGLGVAMVLLLALPFLLRPRKEALPTATKRSDLPVRKLVIISPHWEGLRAEFGRAFSEWTARRFGHATDIEWLDVGGTSDAIRYVRSEFTRSPSGIDIDMFFGGGMDPYLQFIRENLLVPCTVPQEILDRIPRQLGGIDLYDPERRWFGTCLAGFGIVYNKKVLRLLAFPEPATWEDLARPEYFTWVGSGDPRSSGSVHMVYEIILQACGWEKGWAVIMRMSGNTRNFSRNASEVPKDATLGEVACGLAIDTYAWRQVAEVGPDRMGFCLPEGMTVVNPDSIGILRGAPNRDLAEKLIEFVLSEDGQRLWVLKRGARGGPRKFELDRMPLIPGLAASCGKDAAITFDPFKWKAGFVYDAQKGSTRWTAVNDMIGALVIDTHNELVAAWRAVKDLPPGDSRLAEFCRPPLGEQELLTTAKEKWKDAEFRARTCGQWATAAQARYRRIAGGG